MRMIAAPDGVRLRVDEGGVPGGVPLLFIHGFTQSLEAWDAQFAGSLAGRYRLVRFDLRGHGGSDKPEAEEAYGESRRWAGDVDAVMRALALARPIVIGWSYGGYVIADYLREYGSAAIGGFVFAGGASKKGTPAAKPFQGRAARPVWPKLFSDDPAVLAEGIPEFVRLCRARAPDAATTAYLVECNARTPSRVRRALAARTLENDDVLAAAGVPALIVHGAEDAVVDVAAARHHAAVIPGARLAIYPGVGHAPFAEAPERFDADLAAFADAASAVSSTVL